MPGVRQGGAKWGQAVKKGCILGTRCNLGTIVIAAFLNQSRGGIVGDGMRHTSDVCVLLVSLYVTVS